MHFKPDGLGHGFGGGDAAGDTFDSIEIVQGSYHADSIVGDSGANRIEGLDGNDQLTGGTEADTFVFINGTDEDTVTDFEDGIDQLDVSAFFDNAADAVAAARQDGADTVIDLDVGAGDQVRLTGVNVNQIDENDFIV